MNQEDIAMSFLTSFFAGLVLFFLIKIFWPSDEDEEEPLNAV